MKAGAAVVRAALVAGGLGALVPGAAVGGVYVPGPSHTTAQMPGKECSLTEYGPVFPYGKAGWKMRYGGGVSCAGGAGVKTLAIYAQVQSRDRKHWFTIAGSSLSTGPTSANPVRLKLVRKVDLGHAYRVVAVAHVTLPNGERLSGLLSSGRWAP